MGGSMHRVHIPEIPYIAEENNQRITLMSAGTSSIMLQ
jgi:hypothetical protein